MAAAREIRDELRATDGRRIVSVRWLRNRFGQDRLTEAARREIAEALAREGISITPPLADARLDDSVELAFVRRSAWWRRPVKRGVKVWQVAVALLGLAATLTGLYSFGEERLRHAPPLPRLAGDLGIVVPDFGVQDAEGAVRSSPDGHELALLLYRSLERRLAPREQRGDEEPLVYALRGPTAVGPLTGTTTAERGAAATRLAASNGADVVVNGVLRETGGSTELVPEFFINPQKLASASELGGQYRLGAPIELAGSLASSPETSRALREALSKRTTALSEFLVGLGAFTTGAYARAAARLRAAARSPDWLETGGKEVVYLFLGNALLRTGDMGRARDAFERALAIDPGYARARFGLAEIAFQQACAGGAPEDPEPLREAIRMYEAVLAAPDQPTAFPMRVKTSVALGRAELCFDPPHCHAAQRRFASAITAYRTGKSRLREETAEAWGGSAVALELCGARSASAEAVARYRNAVALAELPTRRAYYLAQLGRLAAAAGDRAEAERDYRRAIELEPAPRVRAQYARALSRLSRQ